MIIIQAFRATSRQIKATPTISTKVTDTRNKTLKIDLKHALVKLAHAIDWRFLEQQLGSVYTDDPGSPPASFDPDCSVRVDYNASFDLGPRK